MRWRYGSGLLGVSLLLHLIVFWPSGEVRQESPGGRLPPLRLTLPVQEGGGVVNPGEVGVVAKASSPPGAAQGLHSVGEGRRSVVDPNVKIAADRKNRKPRSTEKPGVPVPADGFTGNDLHKEKLPAKGLDGGFAGASEGRQGGPEGRPGNSLLRYRFALAAAAVALQGAIGVGGAGGGAVVVEVRFSGGSAGSPTLAITQSSGTDELDSTALALLARAARTVPAPPAVGGEALVVSMPVVFDFEGL